MDAISIRNVSKLFKKRTIRREYTTFKSELVRWVRREKRDLATTHLTALKDINITVRQGQTFGLVGRNGSGKSTLLKLVTGIYSPTSGSIDVRGRISALLELGAGFHPDFSGRENILINGIILGMTRREIKARMEEIIAFSEIADFIDEPVRTYSSGMYARLAFSIATHVDPEILIVDEILAVGDEHFARKSAAKMDAFRKSGRTILLVTHDLNAIQRRCDGAAWLDGGTLRAVGNPADIVAQYRQAVAEGEAQAVPGAATASPMRQPTSGPPAEPGKRWGSFEMEVSRVHVLDGNGTPQNVFSPESHLQLVVDYIGAGAVEEPALEVVISRGDGLVVWSGRTRGPSVPTALTLPPVGSVLLQFPRLGLGDGSYVVDVAAVTRDGRVFDTHRGLYGFVVRADSSCNGVVRPEFRWSARAASGAALEAETLRKALP